VKRRSTSGVQRKGRPLVRLKTLNGIDQRCFAYLRAKGIMMGLQNDLGGADNLTVAEHQITQHAAVLGAIIEHHEALWISGEDVNVNEVLASVNCQRRLLTELGLQRRAKDITPSLHQYLDAKVREQGGPGGQGGHSGDCSGAGADSTAPSNSNSKSESKFESESGILE
jgi:hypothetical protein